MQGLTKVLNSSLDSKLALQKNKNTDNTSQYLKIRTNQMKPSKLKIFCNLFFVAYAIVGNSNHSILLFIILA